MADAKQPPAHDAEPAADPAGPWREEEKGRGASTPGNDAGVAGDAAPRGRPTDDRARTEGAAAGPGDRPEETWEDRPAPDPDTPVIGGRGTHSMTGEATEPTPTEPAPTEPEPPRNPL